MGLLSKQAGLYPLKAEVNNGTILKIFLPRYHGSEPISFIAHEQHTTDLTGSETILLVEDEDAVRLFSGRALREKRI